MSIYAELHDRSKRMLDSKKDYLNGTFYSRRRKVEAEIPTAPVETDKTKAIPHNLLYPSTDNKMFRNKDGFHRRQTVFQAPDYEESEYLEEGEATYFTSDDLGGSKNTKAWEVAENSECVKNSAAFFEAYLCERFEDPDLKLVHILAGNRGMTSHSYQVFGFFAQNPKLV